MHFAYRYGGTHCPVKLTTRLSCSRSFSTAPCLRYDGLQNSIGTYSPNVNPNIHARNIAVLGGGISGLATAYNLTKDIPFAKVTIFEQKERLGGWIDSEQVEVDDGSVLFEWGPRNLRPDIFGNGQATLVLLAQLSEEKASDGEIIKDVRGVHVTGPAAVNRYIYYPDHLARLPSPNPAHGFIYNLFTNVQTLLSEPAFKGVFRALINETTKPARSRDVTDSSVGEFLSRRFGSTLTDNVASAGMHGIYAGDVHKLSAATLLPMFWHLETRDDKSASICLEFVEQMFRGLVIKPLDKVRLINRLRGEKITQSPEYLFLLNRMRGTSVYSFVKGLGQLHDAMLETLKANPNVTINTSSDLKSLSYDSSKRKFSIQNGTDARIQEFDYAVSSLAPAKMSHLIQAPSKTRTQQQTPKLPTLFNSPNVLKGANVMVVNLYYKSEQLPIPRGFGYLIPQSVPFEQNPERALGVIFASETSGARGPEAFSKIWVLKDEHQKKLDKAAKDLKESTNTMQQKALEWAKINSQLQPGPDGFEEKTIQTGTDTASGTKLSVMLGGHWWSDWAESDLPSEEDGIEMAKSVIARHLKITEEPVVAKARMQRDCIPQYQVGYREHMGKIHREIVSNFDGRLKVLGPWYQGAVGVNDSVKSAKDVSRRIREGWDHETGLEDYTQPTKFVIEDRRTRKQVMDPLQKL